MPPVAVPSPAGAFGSAVARHRVDLAGGPGGPLVPDVGARPLKRQALVGGMDAIADLDDLLGRGGRTAGCGAGADQAVEERAARLRLGGAADADEAAAALDEGLEGRLLGRVERVGRAEEDDRAVLGEVGRGEISRALGRVDLEVVGGAECLDGGDAGVDRVVGRAVEDEHRGCWRLRAGAGRAEQAEDGYDDDNCRQAPALAHRSPPDLPFPQCGADVISANRHMSMRFRFV